MTVSIWLFSEQDDNYSKHQRTFEVDDDKVIKVLSKQPAKVERQYLIKLGNGIEIYTANPFMFDDL